MKSNNTFLAQYNLFWFLIVESLNVNATRKQKNENLMPITLLSLKYSYNTHTYTNKHTYITFIQQQTYQFNSNNTKQYKTEHSYTREIKKKLQNEIEWSRIEENSRILIVSHFLL